MLVQRVLSPATRPESWTVLGDDDVPVAPIERYLAYLTDIERSPNTIKAYAHDLKDWFVFLTGRGLDWREVRLEDIAGFMAWLRRPPATRDGAVAMLPSVEHHCAESRVNRKLSALSAYYRHASRHGVDLGELLTTWQPGGRRGSGWKPFLHHIDKGQLQPRRAIGGSGRPAGCGMSMWAPRNGRCTSLRRSTITVPAPSPASRGRFRSARS